MAGRLQPALQVTSELPQGSSLHVGFPGAEPLHCPLPEVLPLRVLIPVDILLFCFFRERVV